jgi:mannose-6-phosphate isomerase-like protein (cupin superfamily)
MNLNVSLIAGVYDAFDLGDTRVGAALDSVPTFMTMRLDRALLRPAGARGRGAATTEASPTAVVSRRVHGPSVFSTTWAYVDHVLVPPGATTSELAHTAVGEAYYVLAGTGTVTVKAAASETAPILTGDAIPIRIDESSLFANTGSEPLELLVMGVARDMAVKTQWLSGGNQR